MPFDEDDKDRSVWFLDHDYLENMYGMFKKVNGKYQSYTWNYINYYTLSDLSNISNFLFQQEKRLLAGTTQDQNCTPTT